MRVVCYKCNLLIQKTPNVLGARKFKILCLECYESSLSGWSKEREKRKVA